MSDINQQSFSNYLKFEKRYSEHTILSYQNDINQMFKFLNKQYEIIDVTLINAQMLRSWVVEMVTKKYNHRSINRKISAIRRFFRYLQRKDIIKKNPADALNNLKTKKNLPVFVSEQDLKNIISRNTANDFQSVRDHLIINLLYSAGLRRSELINLTTDDIQSGYVRVIGKGAKERHIPIPANIIKLLQKYLRLRYDIVNQTNRLFITEKGKTLYPKLVYNIVSFYLKNSSAEKKSPHVLRHSYATHLSDRGADLNAIKTLLGHSSLSATQIYTHTSIEKLKNVYKQTHPKAE